MNLLVTGAWNCSPEELTRIKNMVDKVFFLQNEKDELPLSYHDVDGVVCNSLFLYHPIEKFVNLKYIQLTSAGFDRAPMEYILSNNIKIFNARGVYSIPMAEFALSSVLSVYKQTDHFRAMQKMHAWNKHRGLRELFGKRVCIVGCGNVGEECALRFSAMGCDVIGIDPICMEKDGFSKILPVSDLYSQVAISDILVLTLPLTKETRGLINESLLESLPIGAVLVNIARGSIIDTNSLISVFSKRNDLIAVLDVFETEPLASESPLWDMENVIISPHNSFVGEGNAERLCSVIINNLRNYTLK